MGDVQEPRASASEIKFVLDRVLGARVRDWARARLDPDPHGTGPYGDEYRSTSVYFDTENHDVFHRRGSFARAKYRIRRYTDSDFVFLERKLRKPGIVLKRRTKTPINVLDQLERLEPNGSWDGDWFHRRLLARELHPVCQVSYQRMARGATSALRLTLDESVTVAPIVDGPANHLRQGYGGPPKLYAKAEAGHYVHFNGDQGTPVFDQQSILELKFRGHVPTIFKHLVEEFRLNPQMASKYRFGMTALGHDAHV